MSYSRGRFGLMGYLALVLAVVAAISAVLPTPGMFVGMGLSMGALGLGWLGYRQRQTHGWSRLAGAGAMTIALLGLLLSTGRYAMTLWAIEHIDSLI